MTLRVAIVGAGPNGLFALERLAAGAAAEGAAGLQVDVFDPCTPGAGPAYAPTLDPALLMNLRADLIDAWPRAASSGPREAERPDLIAWSEGSIAPGDYVPRATVGRYLHDCWRRVLSGAPAGIRIRHHADCVDDLHRERAGWRLELASGGTVIADAVLLATGHGPLLTDDPRRLPIDQLAGLRSIAVRGAGLTALDLVRGLAARRAGGAGGAGPTVDLLSRTGRAPVPKPAPAVDAQWRERLERIAPAAPSLAGPEGIRGALVDAAAGLAGLEPGLLALELAAIEQRAPRTSLQAASDLEAWLASARGGAPVHPVLALGAAWRWHYPELVGAASFGGWPADQLPALRRLGAALELVAFGPPIEAAATLLVALRAGWVRTWALPARADGDPRGGGWFDDGRGGRRLVDVVIEARQLPPGAANTALITRLVARGTLTVAPGARGVRVARSGAALGGDSDGLAVIGRATEDWVVGNDSLDRSLHHLASAWADATLSRAAADRPSLELAT